MKEETHVIQKAPVYLEPLISILPVIFKRGPLLPSLLHVESGIFGLLFVVSHTYETNALKLKTSQKLHQQQTSVILLDPRKSYLQDHFLIKLKTDHAVQSIFTSHPDYDTFV